MGRKNILLKWAEGLQLFIGLRRFFNHKCPGSSGQHYPPAICLSAITLPWCLILIGTLNEIWLKILTLTRFIVSIGKLTSGSHNYYLNLGQEDYYLSGGEPPGTWYGSGADALGLKGTVSKEVLSSLFQGYSPDGKEKWVQNAGMDTRTPGWDSVSSAPKSVSVTWSQSDFDIRMEIQQAQHEAVKVKNQYLEDVVAYCRKGKNGTEQVRAKLIMANFEHGVSRALDPQLHTHTLIMNLGICEDGKVRAIDGRRVYEYKMAAGAVYRAELARQLRQRLGVRIIIKKTWFEIAGVAQSLMDHFSKRRQDIVDDLGDERLEIASAAAYAALKTRSPKTLVPPRAESFESWQKTGREFDFDINNVIWLEQQRPTEAAPEAINATVKMSINRVSQRRTCFNEAAVLREALKEAMKQGINTESVLSQVRQQLTDWPKEKSWTDSRGRRQYTNLEGSQQERKLKSYVDTIQKRSALWNASCLYVNQIIPKYLKPRTVLGSEIGHHANQFKRALGKKKTTRIDRALVARQAKNILSKQDTELVRGLVRNRGSIQVVNSHGISNIQTVLKACNEAWEKGNLEVWGFSLTRRGATDLQAETGIRSLSFKAFELMRNPTASYRVKHAIKELTRQALFNHGFKLNRFKTKSRLLVVNDAHRLDLDQMNELLRAVKKYGGRVVLVGSTDLRQERTTAFDHVAYRTSRNDQLQTRTEYFTRTPQQTKSQLNERERS